MTRRGGETTKRLCIIFMAAAIFCVAMFPGKGFAATTTSVYYDFTPPNNEVYGVHVKSTGGLASIYAHLDTGQVVFLRGPVNMADWRFYGSTNYGRALKIEVRYDSSLNINFTSVNLLTVDNDLQQVGIKGNAGPDLTPPASPVGLVVVPGENKLTLSWQRNTEEDFKGYYVYLDGTKLTSSSISDLTYTFIGLTGGKTYTLSVSAVDFSGNESPRSSITGIPKSPPPPPDTTPPTVPVLQGKPGKGQAILTWTKSPESDLAGYNLYQDGTKVGNYTTNGATVSGLKNGTQYRFQVTSVDTTGNESAKSNQVAITPVEKMDVNLIPNGDSIVVQIVSGGTGPYVINWGAAQKTVDQSQYVIPNLSFDTEYTVTITDSNGLTYSSKVNTGTEKGYIPPTFPNPQEMFQNMLDVFGNAGTIAMAIIGGAIALGIMCVLAMWGWRLLKRWLSQAK